MHGQFRAGESERAMLRYVLGINTQRREVMASADCDLLLINGTEELPNDAIDPTHWKLVWEGVRQQHLRKYFWLSKAIDYVPP